MGSKDGVCMQAGGVSGWLSETLKIVLQHPDFIPLLHTVCHDKQGAGGKLLQGMQVKI